MKQKLRGIVRGKTIELDEDLGLIDGQAVEVVVHATSPSSPESAWGQGLRRCAGVIADSLTKEDDEILSQIQQARSVETRKEIVE